MENSMMKKYLAAKALGFTNSISNLTREERSRSPSGIYGHDYNGMLQVAKDNFPDISILLPPPVTMKRSRESGEYCSEKYGEIYTFTEQLYQLFSVDSE